MAGLSKSQTVFVQNAVLVSFDLLLNEFFYPMSTTLRLIVPFFLIFLSACSFSLAEDVIPPAGSQQQPVAQSSPVTITGSLYPMFPPDPASGALVFAEKCQVCHGELGLGDGTNASLSAKKVAAIGTVEIAHPSIPSEWYTLLTEGDLERGMPPFNNLTDRQRWDVIAYIYQLSSPPEVITQGEKLYSVYCLRCHGENAQGDGPDATTLPVTPTDLTDQELMAGLSAEMMFAALTNGVGDAMPAFGDVLPESERWALTAYLRSLTFDKPDTGQSAEGSPDAYPAPDQSSLAYPPPPESTQTALEASPDAVPSMVNLGTVRVELVDASGVGFVSHVPVTLYAFDSMQNTYSETLTTNDQGVYTFPEVELLPKRAFIAGAEYSGNTYGSEVMVVEEGMSELTLQIKVYESSTDATPLIIDRLHVFFDFIQEDLVQVIEVFIITNPTNYTVVPEAPGGPVVSFQLPQGFTDLQFQDGVMGERYQEIPGGFSDTTPISPGAGEYQVVFAFNMPYDGKLDFSQTLGMKSSAVVIMLPDVGVKLKGDQITDDGIRDMQGSAYRLYSSSGMQPGSQLTFNLSGKPKTGSQLVTSASTSTNSIAIGMGVFGLALVGAGVWFFARSRKLASVDVDLTLGKEQRLGPQPETQDPSTLMDAIIALDDIYQAGELPEQAYLQRRTELKTQLQQALDNKT